MMLQTKAVLGAVRAGYDTPGGVARRAGLYPKLAREILEALEMDGQVRIERGPGGKKIQRVAPVWPA